MRIWSEVVARSVFRSDAKWVCSEVMAGSDPVAFQSPVETLVESIMVRNFSLVDVGGVAELVW